MTQLLPTCLLIILLLNACTEKTSLTPLTPSATSSTDGEDETPFVPTPSTTTYLNEPMTDNDGRTFPMLFRSVPGSLNRTLHGHYDSDFNAFQAIAGLTYTITLSNFDPASLGLPTVRLEGYLSNGVQLFGTPGGTTTYQFTATQSVRHIIRVADQNSDSNRGGSLGDYTISVSTSGAGQQSVALSFLSLNATAVNVGGSLTGYVTLSTPAPAGGVTVALTSSSGASVPATVVLPAGFSSQSFPITTTAMKRAVTITATYSGKTLSSSFAIVR